MPLRHHGGAVGLLTVLSRTPNAFDDDDLSTLELLAVVLSAAISHAFEFEALTRFHTMFVGASVGIVRFDASGRAVEANPALATMLGYSAAELATIPFTQYTHPDDFGANLTLFTEMMEGKRDTFQLEKRYRRKDPSHPTRSIQRCRRSS